jgi:hypothetical protein
VIAVTDFPRNSCHPDEGSRMRTRVISALLLLFTLSGWMQTFAQSQLRHAAAAAAKPQGNSHSQSHSCCPGVHDSSLLPTVFPLQPASLPCGNSHRCCASRESNNPPSLTATSGVGRPDSRIASFDEIETRANRGFALTRLCDAAALQSYSEISAVLRI